MHSFHHYHNNHTTIILINVQTLFILHSIGLHPVFLLMLRVGSELKIEFQWFASLFFVGKTVWAPIHYYLLYAHQHQSWMKNESFNGHHWLQFDVCYYYFVFVKSPEQVLETKAVCCMIFIVKVLHDAIEWLSYYHSKTVYGVCVNILFQWNKQQAKCGKSDKNNVFCFFFKWTHCAYRFRAVTVHRFHVQWDGLMLDF